MHFTFPVPFYSENTFYRGECKTRRTTLKWFLNVHIVFWFHHYMHVSFMLLFSNNDKKGENAYFRGILNVSFRCYVFWKLYLLWRSFEGLQIQQRQDWKHIPAHVFDNSPAEQSIFLYFFFLFFHSQATRDISNFLWFEMINGSCGRQAGCPRHNANKSLSQLTRIYISIAATFLKIIITYLY